MDGALLVLLGVEMASILGGHGCLCSVFGVWELLLVEWGWRAVCVWMSQVPLTCVLVISSIFILMQKTCDSSRILEKTYQNYLM